MFRKEELPQPFAVDGRPDLSMLVYAPASEDDAAKIAALLDSGQP